MLPVQENYLSI